MRKLYTVIIGLIFISSSISLNGQCCPAPDFTTQDINGNTINLYDILNDGKVVILKVFATWSEASWDHHTSGALNEIWQEFGPEGTDEVMVLFVEGYAGSGMGDLLGLSQSSQGNWLEGTEFPVIDDASIAGLYQIYDYPTVFMICPSKTVFYYLQPPTAQAISSNLHQCKAPPPGLNAGILAYHGPAGEFCGSESFEPEILIQNQAQDTIEQVEIQLKHNGQLLQTQTLELTLFPYQSTLLSFDPIHIYDPGTISFEITRVNGVDDNANDDDTHHVSFTEAPYTNSSTLDISILTDDYGYETYWELVRDDGELVASGGNPNVRDGLWANETDEFAYDNETTYNTTVTIHSQYCYEFTIYDAAGDGICCYYGEGDYSVTDENGNIILSGGAFLSQEVRKINTIQLVASYRPEASETHAVEIFPMPVHDAMSIITTLPQKADLDVTIYDNVGKVVKTLGRHQFFSGSNTLRAAAYDLPGGIYLLQLSGGKHVLSKKFVVGGAK